MKPAARASDMHVCPMINPPPAAIPHIGGPILPLPCNVLIGMLPAAVAGQPCFCTGVPDIVAIGSLTVLVNNRPLARMGDNCGHGGAIVSGCPTVLVGG